MTRLARTLAGLSARRPWLAMLAWLAFTLGVAVGSAAWGPDYADVVGVPGSDSDAAAALLAEAPEGAGSRLVAVAPDALTDTATAAELADLTASVSAVLDVDVVDPVADPTSATTAGAQVSSDGLAVSIPLDVDVDALTEEQQDLALDAITASQDAGWQVAYSGELGRALDSSPERLSEIVGIAAAILVLTVALGSLAAMSVPVIAGLLSVGAGLGLLGLVTHVADIPEIAPTLATMVGLGVGIDYALFQVARLRQALARGADPHEAVLATAASAGAAAAFAGITVALAICALALSGVSFIGWLGYAAAIVVLIVVTASLTFTPALLTVLAPRLRPSERRAAHAGAGTARMARAVVRRPWAIGLAALGGLLLLAVPAASLHLGMSGPGDRAEGSQARTSYDLVSDHFGEGTNATLTVAVQLDDAASGPSDPRLLEIGASLASTEAAAVGTLIPLTGDATVATAQVVPTEGANAESTADLLDDIRAIEAPDGTTIHVGGVTATRIDLADRVTERLPWVMGAVVLVSTLVLMMAFRSLLIPLKAAVLNLISVAASYGVVVAVFQWGWGTSLLGLDGPVAIDSFVPMILFTVLFGLSTDYEVFLVSSMRETWERTGDPREAIVEGMRSSGRVITTAALIMIAVFLAFVANDDPTIKVFGVGLAVSILLDATVIRMVLAPAAMTVMGARAWTLPAWLDRILPSFDAHGSEDEPHPAPLATMEVTR
ncbi:MMPL family transporter [Demequina sp. NBRC 110054]|uniref:MMPL family transporter n=1 Tax=Demequina sp. NBRC 110054 TaxID=1570343 RepID=UPI0013563D16|nr:MMPL family transporter [Demequina sp. NBRC 110054]